MQSAGITMQRSSLLYVSKSMLEPMESELEIARIIATAQNRNASIGITGRLMFTGTHFAQVLEGFDDDINDLISSLRKDIRHRDMAIISRSPLITRRFQEWSMAYSGPSKFVSRFVERALAQASAPDHNPAGTRLVNLMSNF